MATKIDQMEAEAEAAGEIAEEYSGDTLAHKFGQLEATAGADDDLLALKRKMGVAPPEPPPAEAAAPVQVRVAGTSTPAAMPQAEQDELAAAIAELEAEEQREQARMKR
jgi:phage shock protein A